MSHDQDGIRENLRIFTHSTPGTRRARALRNTHTHNKKSFAEVSEAVELPEDIFHQKRVALKRQTGSRSCLLFGIHILAVVLTPPTLNVPSVHYRGAMDDNQGTNEDDIVYGTPNRRWPVINKYHEGDVIIIETVSIEVHLVSTNHLHALIVHIRYPHRSM